MIELNKNNTFCINLNHRKDRWDRIEKIFNNIKLDVTRWEATTPDKVTDKIEGSPGQQGCAQSHINIWRHIIKNNIDYALVLEDDVSFDIKWREKLSNFPYENFNLILLNTNNHDSNPFSWQLIQKKCWSTGAYLLTKETAMVLLKIPFTASDRILVRFQEKMQHNGCYSYFPYLVIQDDIDSDIEGSVYQFDKIKKQLESINYSLDNYIKT